MLAPNTYVRNRYLIVRQVGSGNTGAIYETLDMSSRAHVALKQLPAASGLVGAHLATTLRALRHPALPRVVDHFVEGESEFLASEFVQGDDLAVMLERNGGPFTVTQALRWADQILDALAYLHGLGLVHRDIKPQNLKLTPRGQLMLLDFGLAKPGAPVGKILGAKTVSSLQFMAPEQIQGTNVDARADLYALAATIYYLLTAELPALAGRRANARARHEADPLVLPQAHNPQVSDSLNAVLLRALALDPAQRYESAAAMRAALSRAGVSVPDHPAASRVPAPAVSESRPLPPTEVRPAAPAAETRPLPPTIVAPQVSAPAAPATQPAESSDAAPPPARQPMPRWLLPAAVGAVIVVALLALLLLRRGGDSTAAIPTSAAPSSVPALTQAPSEAPTAAPTSAIQEAIQPQPTRPAGPTLPLARPTAAPDAQVAQVAGVEPPDVFAGAGGAPGAPAPIRLIVRGTNLGDVHFARLVADGRKPLDAAITPASAQQLTLDIAPPAEPLNGEVTYQLELDGQVLETPTVALRDFVERRPVQGVLPEYQYTNRVATDAAGAYSGMRAEANPDSQAVGRLRNGDTVEVLRNDVDGWYQARIHTSGDPAQIGLTGWIERWLVDNQNVPAEPTPAPTPTVQVYVGRVYSNPTDSAVKCGTAFDSSIYGSVENGAGRGIAGARLRVTSADGRNTYNATTGRGGVYNIGGLGCTSWTVQLLSVPGASNGIQANRVVVRNLNGGRYTAAEVRFKLQR